MGSVVSAANQRMEEISSTNTSGLNLECYPAVWIGGKNHLTRHEDGTPSFSTHPRPIEIPPGDLYNRFGTEIDQHLLRIDRCNSCGMVVFLLLFLTLVFLMILTPYFVEVTILFFVIFFGICVFSVCTKRKNDQADEDVRQVCLSYRDEFQRTTGYSPEYQTRTVRTRKSRNNFKARVVVFRPVAALEAAAGATVAVNVTVSNTTTTTTATTTPIIMTEEVDRLMSMGFERESVAEALRDSNNDVELAANRLASDRNTPALPEAVGVLVTPPPPEAVDRLVSMGYEEERVMEALQASNNDVDLAANSLVSEEANTLAAAHYVTVPNGNSAGQPFMETLQAYSNDVELAASNLVPEETNTLAATHYVTVPNGISAGQPFMVDVGGARFQVTCPANSSAGNRIGVHIPNHALSSSTSPQVQEHDVKVPPNVSPGRIFRVDVRGKHFDVTCPPNVRPGQRIRVMVPLG